MNWFTHYNKFWVAIAGFAINAITMWTGIDVEAIGINSEAIVSFITAILVYAIPNTNYETTSSGTQLR